MTTNIIILERDEEKRMNKYKEIIRESKDVRKVFYTRNLENIKEFCKEDSLILNLNDNPREPLINQFKTLDKFVKENKGDIFLVNPRKLEDILTEQYRDCIKIIVNNILEKEDTSGNLFLEDDYEIVSVSYYKILRPYNSFVCYTSNLDNFLELQKEDIQSFESILNNFVNVFDPNQVKNELDKKIITKESIEKQAEASAECMLKIAENQANRENMNSIFFFIFLFLFLIMLMGSNN